MRPMFALALFLSAPLFVFAPAADAAPATLKLDPSRSALHARLYKAGVASGLAHNHVIAASAMTGSVTFDPEAPTAFSVEVTVPVASLRADDPRLRHQYGLTDEIDADDRATIEEHMRDEDQLDAKRYPTIRFVSTAVKATGAGAFAVEGDLTIRGKTRRVSLPVTAKLSAGGFEGEGKLRITHAQFGFEPYSAVLGAVKNQEKIDLILRLVAGQ